MIPQSTAALKSLERKEPGLTHLKLYYGLPTIPCRQNSKTNSGSSLHHSPTTEYCKLYGPGIQLKQEKCEIAQSETERLRFRLTAGGVTPT